MDLKRWYKKLSSKDLRWISLINEHKVLEKGGFLHLMGGIRLADVRTVPLLLAGRVVTSIIFLSLCLIPALFWTDRTTSEPLEGLVSSFSSFCSHFLLLCEVIKLETETSESSVSCGSSSSEVFEDSSPLLGICDAGRGKELRKGGSRVRRTTGRLSGLTFSPVCSQTCGSTPVGPLLFWAKSCADCGVFSKRGEMQKTFEVFKGTPINMAEKLASRDAWFLFHGGDLTTACCVLIIIRIRFCVFPAQKRVLFLHKCFTSCNRPAKMKIWTGPEQNQSQNRQQHPDGCFDLGASSASRSWTFQHVAIGDDPSNPQSPEWQPSRERVGALGPRAHTPRPSHRCSNLPAWW